MPISALTGQQPATLRQLSSVMGLAKGTISFHLRVLREAGLVRLAETRQVRGGTEQYFALISKGFKLHDDAEAGAEFLVQAALAEMLPAREGQAARPSCDTCGSPRSRPGYSPDVGCLLGFGFSTV